MKKYTVITPCYNAENHIRETISSITGQSAFVKGIAMLEYIICDGGSTDRTIQVAETMLDRAPNCSHRIISEPDNGMYDALVKGLKIATGDYCSYLNAGDLYAPGSFEILTEILSEERIQWVTGLRVLINEASQVTGVRLPFRFTGSFIRKGYYGKYLPFIQQESVFWKRELNLTLDFEYLKTLKLAGDYYIWTRFAGVSELHIAETFLGAFRIHKGQQSENRKAYFRERKAFLRPSCTSFLFDLPGILYEWLYFYADYYKAKANKKTMITYDHSSGHWKLLV